MPDRACNSLYSTVLERTGFLRQGKPLTDGVWDAQRLWQATQPRADARDLTTSDVERAFKYQPVIQPEDRGGGLGATHIFELSGSPCIYFKRLDGEPAAAALTQSLYRWQRVAWNHGRAPMLWVVTPTQVRILNAYKRPPLPEEQTDANLGEIEVRRFSHIADQLEELQAAVSRQQITSGEFWSGAGRDIDRKSRLDRQLIADISSAAAQLRAAGMALDDAHRLLLRAIFASFLETRGWLSERLLRREFGVGSFREALADRGTAERLFDWLAETFNGDVFPGQPANQYAADQLRSLKFLLDGGDPRTGQRYLWPYQFDIIPVELLSSIYEEFAHALDPEEAARTSTHYTPVNLVDLTLSQVFDDDLFGDKLPKDARVLDLASGSGVFLAESLRRLVLRRVADGENLTRKLIRDVLYNQVFGVDVSPGAIHVAAVSLYLAALDLDPRPNVGRGVKFRPLICPQSDTKQPARRQFFNLFVGDAFDEDAEFNRQAPFADKQFDLIVGNPPWTRPAGGGQGAKHVAYCRERDIRLPNQNPPDQAFVWRAGLDFARREARLGFLVSARRFFSHHEDSVAAKRQLLTRFPPRLMLNLSELHREELFPSAMHPAMLVVAVNRPAEPGDAFAFAAVERSRAFKRHGTLEIGPEHVKVLSVRRAAEEEDFLKVASWGTARDRDIILQMQKLPPLGEVLADLGVEPHQGFIRGKPKNRTRPVPPELLHPPLPCLETEGFGRFGMNAAALARLEDEWMQWPRDAAIYREPLLLVRMGIGQSGIEATLSNEDIVYSQRYCSIQVDRQHDLWLSCLNGILNSLAATYYLFLSASEWGVERDEVTEDDLLNLPVPSTAMGASPSIRRVAEAEAELRILAQQGRTSASARAELEEAVFGLYGLEATQRLAAEDMVSYTVDLQRNLGRSCAVKPPQTSDLLAYAEQFVRVVDGFLSVRNELRATAEVFELPPDAPLRVVKFRMVDRSRRRRKVRTVARQELAPLLGRIAEALPAPIAERVYTRRHLRVYGPGEVYVIKPAQVRFWCRSAGINDADAVLAEELGGAPRDPSA